MARDSRARVGWRRELGVRGEAGVEGTEEEALESGEQRRRRGEDWSEGRMEQGAGLGTEW